MTLNTIINRHKLTETGMRLALKRIASTVTAEKIGKSTSAIRSCLQDCAEFIHADNRERGWWTDLATGAPMQRNVGELLMLMVSEIAEIPENPAEMDDKLSERFMIEVELADTAIRIFDTAGALAPLMWQGYIAGCYQPEMQDRRRNSQLMRVVRYLSSAMECHRKGRKLVNAIGPDSGEVPGFDYWLGTALHQVFYIGYDQELDVAGAIAEKLEYNRNRADHKPENRRQEGGKAY